MRHVWRYALGALAAEVLLAGVPTQNTVAVVADTANLRKTPTQAAAALIVWRATDGVAGSPPLPYAPDIGHLCSADDGGSCIAAPPNSTLPYWLAQFDASGADARQWSPAADAFAGLQAAFNWAGATNGTLRLPPGTWAISSTLVVPPNTSPQIIGAGSKATFINQTNATGGCIAWNNTTLHGGGGVQGFTCEANGQTVDKYSSGIGISTQYINVGWSARDVFIGGFATDATLDGDWDTKWQDDQIYGADTGISIGCNAAFPSSGGNRFSADLIQRNGKSYTSVGIQECASGGNYFDHSVEIDGWGTGAYFVPRSGAQISLDRINFNIDSSLGVGLLVDPTNGVVIAAGALWSDFNNQQGVNVLSGGSNYASLNLTNAQLRENGLQAIYFGSTGGTLNLTGATVAANSRGQVAIVTAGSGCSTGDHVAVVGGTGGPLVIQIASVDASGAVQTARAWSSAYYSVPPTNPVSVTGGTCAIEPTFNLTWPANNNAIELAAGQAIVNSNTIGNFASPSTSTGACMLLDGTYVGVIRSRGNVCIGPKDVAWINNVPANGNNFDWSGYADVTLRGTATNVATAGTTVYLGQLGPVVAIGTAGWISTHILACDVVGYSMSSAGMPANDISVQVVNNGSLLAGTAASNAGSGNQVNWSGGVKVPSGFNTFSLAVTGVAGAPAKTLVYSLYERCQ